MFVRHIVTLALGLTFVMPVASFAAPARQHPRGVNAREHRQAARIRHGVRDGEINRREADKLFADEAAVRAEERVYRSGDGLGPRERRDLERDLNRTNREIRRATRNSR
jgi:Ni/Co efflux regulator RcnB